MTTVENDMPAQETALTEGEQMVIRQLSKRLWMIGAMLLLLSVIGAVSTWQSGTLDRAQPASRQSVDSDDGNSQPVIAVFAERNLLWLVLCAFPTFRAAWSTTKATRQPGPNGRRELLRVVRDYSTFVDWVLSIAFLAILAGIWLSY